MIVQQHIHLQKLVLGCMPDGAQSTFHEAFLKRLTETGAIETSSLCDSSNKIEGDRDMAYERSKNSMCNLVSAMDNLWNLKDEIHGAVLKKLSADGESY